MGTERLDDIKSVFAINGSNIKGMTMDIFTGNRQVFKLTQSGATNIGQLINIIGADIEDGSLFFLAEKYLSVRQTPSACPRNLMLRSDAQGRH